MIGCVEHQEDVTSPIIKFLIIFRLNIICKDRKTADLVKQNRLQVHFHWPCKVAPHSTTPKRTVQNRAEWCKTVLVTTKKIGVCRCASQSHFCMRTFDKKAQSLAKTSSLGNTIIQKWIPLKHRHWVTPLFKSGISLLRRFGELYAFF